MDSERVIGTVLYGEAKKQDNLWNNWYSYAESAGREMDCKLTHVSIMCDSLNGGLKTLSRSGKKILGMIHGGEKISALAFYALKKGFRSVVDSEICFILNAEYRYAYCEIPFEKFDEALGERILKGLGSFVICENCEIFSMEKNQVAFNYVMKGRGYERNEYPTLKILYSGRTDAY